MLIDPYFFLSAARTVQTECRELALCRGAARPRTLSRAKVRNNLRTNPFPLEKLTNRHEKGRERLFPHLVLRDFVLAAVKDDGTGKVRRRYGEDALLP